MINRLRADRWRIPASSRVPASSRAADSSTRSGDGVAALTRLLVVDSTPGGAMLVRVRLEGRGYQVHEAASLAEATRLLAGAPFDIALVDLDLSDSVGGLTYTKISRCRVELPIVVVSSDGSSESGLAALREGAQDHLAKSKITAELLDRCLQYALERSRERAQSQHVGRVLRALRDLHQVGQASPDPSVLVARVAERLVELGAYRTVCFSASASGSPGEGAEPALRESTSGPISAPVVATRSLDVQFGAGDALAGGGACAARASGYAGEVVVVEDGLDCARCVGRSGCPRWSLVTCLARAGQRLGLLAVELPPGLAADGEVQRLFEEVAGDLTRVLREAQIVDERSRSAAMAEAREEELRAALSINPDIVLVVDEDRVVRMSNAAAQDAGGWSPGEEVGETAGAVLRCVNAHVHPDGCGHSPDCGDCGVRQLVRDCMVSGSAVGAEQIPVRLQRPTGLVDTTVDVVARMLSLGEQPRLMLSVRAKQSEQAESSPRDLFEQSPIPSFVLNGAGRIGDVNAAARTLWETPVRPLRGLELSDLCSLAVVLGVLSGLRSAGAVDAVPAEVRGLNGVRTSVSLSGRRLDEGGGYILQMVPTSAR